eukprot:TRINITY_DN5029_c0_g1_i13.p1 TRINITY_DN5029_c0_g1~~TRINITY_DN5029_c0_g1_i13.p1  ORF type:complete len:575 (+),score=115.14 TRINITY_DN5029_c0_g1_i13:70-1794(+)
MASHFNIIGDEWQVEHKDLWSWARLKKRTIVDFLCDKVISWKDKFVSSRLLAKYMNSKLVQKVHIATRCYENALAGLNARNAEIAKLQEYIGEIKQYHNTVCASVREFQYNFFNRDWAIKRSDRSWKMKLIAVCLEYLLHGASYPVIIRHLRSILFLHPDEPWELPSKSVMRNWKNRILPFVGYLLIAKHFLDPKLEGAMVHFDQATICHEHHTGGCLSFINTDGQSFTYGLGVIPDPSKKAEDEAQDMRDLLDIIGMAAGLLGSDPEDIKSKFVVAMSDGGDASVVRPLNELLGTELVSVQCTAHNHDHLCETFDLLLREMEPIECQNAANNLSHRGEECSLLAGVEYSLGKAFGGSATESSDLSRVHELWGFLKKKDPSNASKYSKGFCKLEGNRFYKHLLVIEKFVKIVKYLPEFFNSICFDAKKKKNKKPKAQRIYEALKNFPKVLKFEAVAYMFFYDVFFKPFLEHSRLRQMYPGEAVELYLQTAQQLVAIPNWNFHDLYKNFYDNDFFLPLIVKLPRKSLLENAKPCFLNHFSAEEANEYIPQLKWLLNVSWIIFFFTFFLVGCGVHI